MSDRRVFGAHREAKAKSSPGTSGSRAAAGDVISINLSGSRGAPGDIEPIDFGLIGSRK